MNALALLDNAKTPAERRSAILALEQAALSLPADARVESPVRHYFAPGQYAREILLCEGELTGGKLHRHAHLNVISRGAVLVYTEFGTQVYRAPCTFVSQPGTKRVVLPLETTVWTTIHANPNELRDIAALEAEILAPDYEALGHVEQEALA